MPATILVTLQVLTYSIFAVGCLQSVSHDSPDCVLVLGESPPIQTLSLAMVLALVSGTIANVNTSTDLKNGCALGFAVTCCSLVPWDYHVKKPDLTEHERSQAIPNEVPAGPPARHVSEAILDPPATHWPTRWSQKHKKTQQSSAALAQIKRASQSTYRLMNEIK